MTIELGFTLSSEEHPAGDLVEIARLAEEAGFAFLSISDHFHPWTDRQGESPFVWSVVGAVANATERIPLQTGVTCPTIRIHPAIVAQAAATCAQLMPGRFSLGLGSGENLNEHIAGGRWPAAAERLEMLEEAIDVIHELWSGEETNHRGRHYVVENARIYSMPDEPPRILVAGTGPKSASLAAEKGDGVIGVSPDEEFLSAYRDAGGSGPRYGQVNVCHAASEDEGRRLAHEIWPNVGIPGELSQELPLPRHFEQAAETVTEEMVDETVACGPDPEQHLEQISRFASAGFSHVFVHQIGTDLEGQRAAIEFYAREILPNLERLESAA